MKKFRLLSAFLSVVLAMGMFSAALPVSAANANAEPPVPGIDEDTGTPTIDYLSQIYKTPEDKLATMTKYLDKGNFSLYVEPVSGEVAYVNNKTGQILFSNPYDVSSTDCAKSLKQELLSQITIKYVDNTSELEMFSFVEACQRGQINVKKIKNGVRVEYTMGREETRKLVPKRIEKERFEELLVANFPEGSTKNRFTSYYTLQDPNAPGLTERGKRELLAAFPICNQMAIYVFDPTATERELNLIEGWIKTYCPEYTYETLEEDHTITDYVGVDKAPVLFRLSLEYKLDDDGSLDVRLPANGIRFDESAYQLTYISMLPWFGAGSSDWEGYTFIPDGSGTLVRFQDVETKSLTLTGKIYGQDYAYQEVSGQNKEIMRFPVYGIVETDKYDPPALTFEQELMGFTYKAPEGKLSTGFIAIIEEGDSLAEISTEHGGNLHKYNTVYTTFYPRPKDTYNLADAISVGSDATYTVVSERKYTGSYRIKYIMLTSEETAKAAGVEDYYEDSYVGMAKAYRDYLIEEGILTEIKDPDNDIPLYIESFGAIETIERILSIPVTVLKPLTTFEDLKTMYTTLSEAGITNVNYKLTGYTNGGMNNTYPYHVEFETAVGGNDGFKEFVEFANENSIGVYPDFDFANVKVFEAFDGISKGKHLIKTMDNRYTTKRHYDSTLQSFERGYSLAISPSVYEYVFENFNEEYSKLSPIGISVSTLGTDLNSDFDEDEPYNREDTKVFTTDLLADIDEAYGNVMINGGNMYAVSYADHIIGAPLDSSRYSNASEAVPFVGLVLHGCVGFAGNAINMAGDTDYELLKAIENGASLYFTLSMQNTSLLKEDVEFNKYYSVAFDIWKDEVVEIYTTLNDAIGDLQDKQIVGHEFLIGERVPTAEEAEADRIAAEEAAVLAEEEAKIAAEKAEKAQKLADRLAALKAAESGETVSQPTVIVGSASGVIGGKTDGGNDEYVYTKYTSDDGRIVKVTYEGGVSFILNYNNFEITVEDGGKTYTVGALDFVKVK